MIGGAIVKEIWKTIEEYPEYEVSNLGNVRSKTRDYIDSLGRKYHKKGRNIKLKKQIDKFGYAQIMVSIRSARKMHRLLVHRLVAKAFIPNPLNYPQVNHIDENSTNNCVENLEWCTAIYNVNYGHGIIKRASHKAKVINIYDDNHNLIETLSSGIEVSKKYNISRGYISIGCNSGKLIKGYFLEFVK